MYPCVMKPGTVIAALAATALLAGIGPAPRSADAADSAALDIPVQDLEGRTRTLDDWSGRTRLVNFWATWCGPCREEMPLFQDAYERFAGKGLVIIGVALDRVEAVSRFKEQLGITYPIVMTATRTGRDMMRRYGDAAGAIPYSVLLSPDGEVLASHLGAFSKTQLSELLDRHLEDRSPATEMTRGLRTRAAGTVAVRYRHLGIPRRSSELISLNFAE